MERTLQEIMSKSDKKPAGGTSSEEMEARVSARKARQRVERAKSAQRRAPMTSYGRLAATAAAAVIAVGSFIYGQATSSTYESELAEGSTRIAELRDEINRASSEVESMPSAQQMGASLSAAAERGAELLAAQNEMKDNRPTPGDEAELAAYGERTDMMKRFFTTAAVSGSGDFLPHGMWYSPHVPGVNEEGRSAWVPMPSGDWGWEMTPSMEVLDDGSVPVVFEARIHAGDDAGELMSWVIAKYDPATSLFYGLRQGHTPTGQERLGATTSPEAFGSASKEMREVPDQAELFDQAERAADRAEDDGEQE